VAFFWDTYNPALSFSSSEPKMEKNAKAIFDFSNLLIIATDEEHQRSSPFS
jgi:hypothetical protein